MLNEFKQNQALQQPLQKYVMRSKQRQAILIRGIEQLLSEMKNENR